MHDHSQRLSPEEDFQIAQQALQDRDPKHAIFHLSWALEADPQKPEYLSLLRRIIGNEREPISLVEPDEKGGLDYARAAVRAFILAEQGKYEEAIGLISQIWGSVHAKQYLAWAGEWLSKPERVDRVNSQTLLRFVMSISSMFGDYVDDGRSRDAIGKMLPAIQRAQKANVKDGVFISMSSVLWRKTGQVDTALQVAQEGYRVTPDYFPAVFVAGAYKSKGDLMAAVEWFKKSLQHKPDDVHVRLDIGDTLCKAGEIAEGITYYQQALDLDPNQPWAKPHLLYYQAKLTKQETWIDQLQAYSEANPDNHEAANLLWKLTHEPLVDYLPEPSDATINILRHVASQKVGMSSIGLNVLEAPSTRLALDLYNAENNGDKVKVNVAEIQQPDPRYPNGKADYVLWKYDGIDPVPNMTPPSPQMAEAVAKIASKPYQLSSWLAAARKLGAAAGSQRVEGLLSVMVHPPKRPDDIPVWVWIQRVQVAAALSLAYVESGWDGSERKKALVSLARGPMDWTVGAAIIALTQIALEEPDKEAEVLRLFNEVFGQMPRPGAVPYMDTLVLCLLRLPHLDAEARKELELLRNDLGY
jgi:tetratricopeptide (TPR) repeat protein